MTTQEALQVFGNTISAKYSRYQGGEEDITFTYSGVSQASGYILVNSSQTDFDPSEFVWLVYASPMTYPDPRPAVIQFDISPTYSIIDTNQIHTAIALTTGNNPSPSAATYQSPQWNWNINGSSVTFENQDEDGNGLMAYFYGYTFSTANPFYYNYVPMDFSSQSTISAYSYRATFYGQYADGYYWLMLAVPYISQNASGETGIVTTSSGTTTTAPAGSATDLTETNGLISSVISAITNLPSTIASAIRSLFVPEDGFMDDFKDDMQDLLEDHLGGLYQAIDLIEDFISSIINVTPHSTFTVPAVTLPLAGASLQLGNWTLDVHSDAIPAAAYELLKFIIDFLALAAFLNMCRYKLEIFLNPDTEVVKQDDY